MSLRPLADRVVVRRLESETITTGGIVIPDSAAEQPNQGEVIAVGPGARLNSGDIAPLTVKIGDRILFGKYTSNEVTINGEEFLILKESDIHAVIETDRRKEKAA